MNPLGRLSREGVLRVQRALPGERASLNVNP